MPTAHLIEKTSEVSFSGASAKEKYRVTDCSTATIAYNTVGKAVGSNAISIPGLNAYSLPVTAIAISQVLEGAGKVFDVDVTYGVPSGGGASTTSYSMSADMSGEYVDVWRANPTISNSDSPGATTDIGGTSVDAQGEPMSVFRVKSQLSITTVKTSDAFFGDIWSAIGQRNSDTFEGATVGKMLFTGARVQTDGQCQWQVTYNFVTDDWYHMVQRPDREPDMRVVVESDSGSARYKRARLVTWVQPFPNKTSFSTLVGASNPC